MKKPKPENKKRTNDKGYEDGKRGEKTGQGGEKRQGEKRRRRQERGRGRRTHGKGKDIPCRDIKKGETSPPFFFVLSTNSFPNNIGATRCSGHGADS